MFLNSNICHVHLYFTSVIGTKYLSMLIVSNSIVIVNHISEKKIGIYRKGKSDSINTKKNYKCTYSIMSIYCLVKVK